ncbi:hypothetical protein COV17_03975 [Candidatus Woesearchaeota archaeon CG10_big_fil_rev_8_21_14_0_10_36_11]|nr:MAG: hypothetical protein COV17_03975 [Candidatus Woesearchaeota archaeon CG10_big_fil_rev_8_21_14_0_10_36_11]
MIPATRNKVPPTCSHFHATSSMAIKTNVGIKCMKSAANTSGNKYSPKTSNANKLMKMVKTIVMILGIQYRYFFFMSW